MAGVSHPLQIIDSQGARVQTAQTAYPLSAKSKCKNNRERISRVATPFTSLAAPARDQVLLKDHVCLFAVAAGDLCTPVENGVIRIQVATAPCPAAIHTSEGTLILRFGMSAIVQNLM